MTLKQNNRVMNGSSNGSNAAAIFLWVLIVIIVIIIIVWIACECSKKNKKNVKVVAFGDGNKRERSHKKSAQRKTNIPNMTQEDNHLENSSQNWSDMEMPFADSHGGGMPYESYGAHGTETNKHEANGSNFPTEEDNAARFPKNPPVPGSGGAAAGPDSVCAPAGDSKYGFNLNVNHLMPASWRGDQNCGVESEDSTQWAAYAPSKAAFDSYITTAGSARLAVNTRTAQARQTGMPNPLADMRGCGGGPPVPIGADAVLFNDSDFRQTLIYNSTGNFPELTWC